MVFWGISGAGREARGDLDLIPLCSAHLSHKLSKHSIQIPAVMIDFYLGQPHIYDLKSILKHHIQNLEVMVEVNLSKSLDSLLESVLKRLIPNGVIMIKEIYLSKFLIKFLGESILKHRVQDRGGKTEEEEVHLIKFLDQDFFESILKHHV